MQIDAVCISETRSYLIKVRPVAWLPSAFLALHPRSLVYGLPKSRLDFHEGVLGRGDYVNRSMLYETMSNIKENIRVDSGTEDELSAPSKLFCVTPRNSAAGQACPTEQGRTPFANVSNPGRSYGNYC